MENRINYIYYFTGTGNSLQIAQDIAKGIGSGEIRKISEYKGEKIKNISGKDTLTIVFPAYYGGIPRIIDRFLDSLAITFQCMMLTAAVFRRRNLQLLINVLAAANVHHYVLLAI